MNRLVFSIENIRNDWSQLRNDWRICRDGWNDGVASRFEQQYWQEYERVLPFSVNTLENLDNLIQRAIQEVK